MKHANVGFGILALTVLFLSFLAVVASADRSLNPYDEGVILTGAMRVASGAVPHRDFYANYGPGQFYVLAMLFKLFHPSVLLARFWGAFIKALLAVSVLLVGRRLVSKPVAVMCCVITVIWLCYVDNTIWPAWTALALSLVSCLPILDVFEGRRSSSALIAAGCLLGMAALFRYDIGFLVLCAELTVLAAHSYGTRSASQHWQRTLSPAILFVSGVSLVAAITATVFLATGAMRDFIFDVVIFPAHFYAKTRSLPFPVPFSATDANSLAEYVVYFPPFVSAAALCQFLLTRNKAASGATASNITPPCDLPWALLLLASVTLGFFAKSLVRVSALHMSLAVIPGSIVFAACLSRFRRNQSLPAALLAVAAVTLGVPTLAATSAVGERIAEHLDWAIRTGQREYRSASSSVVGGSCHASRGFERLACISISVDEFRAAEFVQARSELGDCIFVGLPQHSRVYVNNVSFYFIVDLPPATKWYHFDPGLQTSETTQELVINDLERKRPRFVILDSEWEYIREPNASATSSGVVLLDEYIASHFRKVATFGTLSVLELESKTTKQSPR